MRAGVLRDRVLLQSHRKFRDPDGGVTDTWEDEEYVWAKVWALRGREYVQSREQHADITIRVIIRYRPDVTPSWRIKFGERILHVVHVIDLQGRRRELELMCREVVT